MYVTLPADTLRVHPTGTLTVTATDTATAAPDEAEWSECGQKASAASAESTWPESMWPESTWAEVGQGNGAVNPAAASG